jgi:hypothetical protein
MKWSPDTCECIFECVIDQDGVDLDWISTYNTCETHKDLMGQILLDTVMTENRTKNLGINN